MNASLMFLLLVLALVITTSVALDWRYGPLPYRNRKCTGRKWRTSFPNLSKEEIRLFLDCLVGGMGFSQLTRLKFEPSDRVSDIYRSVYGGRTPLGDAMECETFAENLARSFEIPLDTIYGLWHSEVTLGELAQSVTSRKSSSADRTDCRR